MKKQVLILATALLSISTYAQIPTYVPANGLVGWWPFNGNANDESGNGNHGTVNGATLTQDRFGNANMAYYFSSAGCATYIGCNINTASITSGITIGFWAQRIGNGCLGPRIINFYAPAAGPGTVTFNWPNNTAQPSMAFVTSSFTSGYYPFDAVSNSTWAYFCYTNDGVLSKLYQDGTMISQQASSGQISLAGNANFGRMTNPAYDAFNGCIDDIGIWNRALTACEISDLYNSQLGTLNTSSTLNETALDTYTWPINGQTYTQSGTYTSTIPNAAGCDSIITLNLTLNFTGLNELGISSKNLLRITDLNGKNIPRRKNTLMLFIYEDGTVERVLEME